MSLLRVPGLPVLLCLSRLVLTQARLPSTVRLGRSYTRDGGVQVADHWHPSSNSIPEYRDASSPGGEQGPKGSRNQERAGQINPPSFLSSTVYVKVESLRADFPGGGGGSRVPGTRAAVCVAPSEAGPSRAKHCIASSGRSPGLTAPSLHPYCPGLAPPSPRTSDSSTLASGLDFERFWLSHCF